MIQATVRIFKGWETRDSLRRWVNNYEIQHVGGTTPMSIVADCMSLVNAEKVFHLTPVQFLSMTISTWAADSQPYNPLSFTTVSLSGTGATPIPEGDDALDTNIAWFCTRQVNGGRQGKLFYRGCLTESDVEMGSDGYFKFTSASPYRPGGAMDVAMNSNFGQHYVNGANQATLALLATYGESETVVVRGVTGIRSMGIVINRRNHRYFDRALG